MNDSLDEIFGLSAFRPDVYNSLMNSWCYHGDSIPCDIANGYAYMRTFPPFYFDYTAAADSLVMADPESFSAFPALQLRYRNGTRMPPPAVSQTAAGERSRLLLESVAMMNNPDPLPLSVLALMATGEMAEGHAKYPPIQYMNDNISQYHRAAQERVAGAIRRPMHNLVAWLLNHIEQEEGVFSLRPFHNMPGPYQDTLRGADVLSGIHNPSMYWTKSQHLAAEQMEAWGLSHYFKRVTDIGKDQSEASWNQQEWQYWNDRAAYAVIRYPNGSEVGIGPTAMIPPLWCVPRDKLPMFWSVPGVVPLLAESVYWVQYLSGQDVAEEQAAEHQPTFDEANQWGDNYLTAQILAAICFYATLVVAQKEMGRGHHKPFWTQTPLNMAVCNMWHRRILTLEAQVNRE